MKRSLQIKIGLIVVLTAWSIYSLLPTLQLSALDRETADPERISKLQDRSIKQGLDLQGGMYLVLEIDQGDLEGAAAQDAIDRVEEILRNRVDQFGVSEPDIRREGASRIIVQLPGLQDAERAKRLIGRTARMEFRMVREGAEVNSLLTKLDRALSGATVEDLPVVGTEDEEAAIDEAVEEGDEVETAVAAGDTVAGDLLSDLGGSLGEGTSDLPSDRPFSELTGMYFDRLAGIPVSDANRPRVQQLLGTPAAQRAIPRDVALLWGSESHQGQDGQPAHILHLVNTKVELTGGELQTASVSPDPKRPPALMVNVQMTRRGGIQFSNVTGANVGRHMAIVIDDVVISAPTINEKIPSGSATISGGFTNDAEASDLALMLRAGALPVDVSIEEERTVGPSLGRDSIDRGINASLVGGALVVLFMFVYYRAAGVLATLGLVMTLLLLMGILTQLHLTLTLPGIAGIILTVGMAVDANVLIFERIREELRSGKSVRAAIDSGYAAATRAIVDANITTFIAGIVLYYFGTGPIRGFAVTLSIGILTSMFSALVFTRTIYDLWLGSRSPRSLSI